MEKDELEKLAAVWQIKFKKKYQNSEQVLAVIRPSWEEDHCVTVGYLYLLASSGNGSGKSHVSAEVDSETLMRVKHPRSRHPFKPTRVR